MVSTLLKRKSFGLPFSKFIQKWHLIINENETHRLFPRWKSQGRRRTS